MFDRTKLVGALRSFIDGLTAGSLSSALAAIGVAVAELVLAVVLVTPRNIARIDPRYLKESRADDLAEVTAGALQMRFADTGHRGVLYLGASNANRALYAHGRGLEREISEAAGEAIDFYRLSADNETMGEWVILLDQVPPTFRGVAVLSVCDQARRFTNRSTLTKFALTSPTLRHPPRVYRKRMADSLFPVAKPIGNYFLDNLSFFASRRSVLARVGLAPLRGVPRPNAGKKAAYWRKMKRTLARRKGGPPLLRLLPQLERIVASLKRRHIEVVLVEAPVNPSYDGVKPRRQSRGRYEPTMFAFAKRVGAHYWNPGAAVRLKSKDFADEIHVRDKKAEQRWEANLVKRLGELLRGAPVEDGPPTPAFGSHRAAGANGDDEE